MYLLSQSAKVAKSAGEPLPNPFKGLIGLEAEFRRGELSIVAAASGTGKSVLALNLAVQSNVPALYFSADSTATTQLTRATAILTGHDARDIKRALHEGAFDTYAGALNARWWQRFNYSARPTPEEIELHLKCYFTVYNVHPHLVVIDNLTNVDLGGARSSDEVAVSLEGLCDYLSEMARVTGSHVMATHHVVGEYSDGTKPIPQSGVKGKISRVPSLILTIHKETGSMGGRILNVSPVKNREGEADPSGETYASLEFDTRNIRLTDIEAPVGF